MRTLLATGRAIAARPDLWRTALRQTATLARPGWWRTWPPFPSPDRDYLHFRLVTQYGGDGGTPEAGDVVQYLEWCRQSRELT
ncbi:MAG TPA: hypothetical protein VNB24_07890 [Acidimicrobiales bacterium]|nr:hypothetical protein [Acidimicrobiales bacterium]